MGPRAICLLAVLAARAAGADPFHPGEPYSFAAGKQSWTRGRAVTRWFEVEIRNPAAAAVPAHLLVFGCTGLLREHSGPRLVAAGTTELIRIDNDAACLDPLAVAEGKLLPQQKEQHILVALLQTAHPAIELSVRAQFLNGDRLTTYTSEGLRRDRAGRRIRGRADFESALVMNASDSEALVVTCGRAGPQWFQDKRLNASCLRNPLQSRLPAWSAQLLLGAPQWPAIHIETPAGLLETVVFAPGAASTRQYNVETTITYEPK